MIGPLVNWTRNIIFETKQKMCARILLILIYCFSIEKKKFTGVNNIRVSVIKAFAAHRSLVVSKVMLLYYTV